MIRGDRRFFLAATPFVLMGVISYISTFFDSFDDILDDKYGIPDSWHDLHPNASPYLLELTETRTTDFLGRLDTYIEQYIEKYADELAPSHPNYVERSEELRKYMDARAGLQDVLSRVEQLQNSPQDTTEYRTSVRYLGYSADYYMRAAASVRW